MNWRTEIDKRMKRQERSKQPLRLKPLDGTAIQTLKNALHDGRSVTVKIK